MVPFHKRGKVDTLELEAEDFVEMDESDFAPRRPAFPSPPASSLAPRIPAAAPSRPAAARPTPRAALDSLFESNDAATTIFSPDATGPMAPLTPSHSVQDRPRPSGPLPPVNNAFLEPAPTARAALFRPLSNDEYTSLRPPPSAPSSPMGELGREFRPLIGHSRPPQAPSSTLSTAPIAFSSHAELATTVRPSRRPKLVWAAGLVGGLAAGLGVAMLAYDDSFVSGAANLVDSTNQGTARPGAEAPIAPPVAPIAIPAAKPFESALQAAAQVQAAEPVTNFIQPRPEVAAPVVNAAGPVVPAVAKTEARAETPKPETAKVADAPKVETHTKPAPRPEVHVAHVAPPPPKPAAPKPPIAHAAEPKKSGSSADAAKLADEQLKAALGN